MNRRRIGGWAAAGAGAAVAGVGLWWLRERRTERPAFELLRADGDYAVRRYPALVTAQTVQAGARDRALGSGFGLLAKYIFARGRPGPAIAMTAPVISEPAGVRAWRTRFVMPAMYAPDTLPAPAAGVGIETLPARTIAVLAVRGRATDRILAAKRTALLARVAADGARAGAVSYAFYNSPFVPAPLRLSEIWVELLD